MKIREIQAVDNDEIRTIVRSVLLSYDVPKVKSAYADVSLENMYEAYNTERSYYFVAEDNGKILGGAGIAALDNHYGNVCELQKMYLLPEARGKGLGNMLIDKCIEKAKALGYDQCYLETVPGMKKAQKIYLDKGFKYLDRPMGDTGHSACQVWMLKELNS